MAGMVAILVVDNYDSFTYNIVQYLAELGADCEVRRNDAVTVAEARAFDGILLSPGPGTPEDSGVCLDILRRADTLPPIFGVCLGMQAMGHVYGGTVGRAPELLHGKTSAVHHSGAGVFRGLPSPFIATRYHSLAVSVDDLPTCLVATARTADGILMGLRHAVLDVEGVQFHPESILTEYGHAMLATWLERCGASGLRQRARELDTAQRQVLDRAGATSGRVGLGA